MKTALLLLFLCASAEAGPPFYLRKTETNQSIGGINQNFQDQSLSNVNRLAPVNQVAPLSCPSGYGPTGWALNNGSAFGGTCSAVSILSSTETETGGKTFTAGVTFSSWTVHAGSSSFTSATTTAFTAPISISSAAPATPAANTLYKNMIPKAFAVFSTTGTVNFLFSVNVTSVTKNSTGNYNINFATPFSDTNYSCVGSADRADVTLALLCGPNVSHGGAVNTTSFPWICANDGGTPTDSIRDTILCFGNQ